MQISVLQKMARSLERLLAILIVSVCALGAAAATATIERVWLEHGVKINGRQAMKVHCSFKVQQMKGRTGAMCIWVQDAAGRYHNVRSDKRTSQGTTYFSYAFTPGYENATYSDFWYAPYIDDLNLKAGKHDYKIFVTLIDPSGRQLARSQTLTFSGTGSGSPAQSAPQRQPSNSGNVVTRREELGYGGFVIVREYPTGMVMRTRYRLCPNCRGAQSCASCRGTGRCSICQGRGGIVTAGYGNFIPCAACGQTGRCHLCGGMGKCACTKYEYPGYAIGSTSTIMPDGTVNRETAEYNNYNSGGNNSNRSSGGKKVCPDCGGTRLWHRGKSPEYARPNSQLVGYYNSSGSKCPHCGYYSEHWHSKCATCKHYAGTNNPYR